MFRAIHRFLCNATIRMLVLSVLVLISGLVMLMSALGVKALSDSGKVLDASHIYLQEVIELSKANDQFMRLRLRLGRQYEYQEAGHDTQARDEAASVQKALVASQQHFQRFQGLAGQHGFETEVGRVVSAYQALQEQGLTPLVQALAANDLPRYRRHHVDVTVGLSRAFEQHMASYLSLLEQHEVEQADLAAQARQRATIAMLAVLGFCLLLALLADRYVVGYVRKPLNLIRDHCKRIATGDLTGRIELFGRSCVGALFPYMREMQAQLVNTVSQVRHGVDEIHNGAQEISAGNNDLSSRTEQQAASLQETAASMEELSSTVTQSADHAQQVRQMAATAGGAAEKGGKAVEQVVTTMQDIAEHSRRIGEIIGVIDSIAFQTNILALNAAVEAARAGEQGRGFAVVAAEVRALAQRSANSAREIKELIQASEATVGAGTQLAASTGQIMAELLRSVRDVNGLVEEMAAAAQEQAGGISQVNIAVGQMDQVTQQNAALVEQSAAAAASLEQQAGLLHQAVAVFRLPAEGEVIELDPSVVGGQVSHQVGGLANDPSAGRPAVAQPLYLG